jgi:DNA-binding SARP family transcriptional activator
VEIFQRHLHAASDLLHRSETAGAMSALHQALHACRRGDFLENFRTEEWIEDKRNHFREKYLQALIKMSDYFFGQKDFHLTINICNQLLDADNTLEPAHQRLMECYLFIGEGILAIRQYKKCEQMMRKFFETGPSRRTMDLYRQAMDSGTSVQQAVTMSAYAIRT